MTTSTRERRDWTLLIFIIPIGIVLMLIAGQIAIHLVPIWSINAGMKSNLDPNDLPSQQNIPMQPVLPAILTPLGWFDTFLTPGAGSDQDIIFPPFVVFKPTSTPAVTLPPPTPVTTQPPTVAATSPTVVVTQPTTVTQKPPVDGGTPVPPTDPPTTVPTVAPPVSTPTGIPSTPPPLYVSVNPPPEIGVNAPPDGNPGEFPSLIGSYTVIDIGASGGIKVSSAPDGNYDLVFYEAEYPTGSSTVQMDQISIGISKDGVNYYQVFNWGDNIPDKNSNVDYTTLPADPSPSCTQECDNRQIPTTDLYPGTSGPAPSTGILIDVDQAPSAPPEGTYNYLVIISPPSVDSSQVDSIVVTEVPIPP